MAIIDYSLDHFFYRNALFWAERLVALDSTSPYFAYYRALSFYRAGQVGRAYDTLVHAPPFFALPPPPLPADTTRPSSNSHGDSEPARDSTSEETQKIARILGGVNMDPSCQYLLARCCFDLGNLAEGIDAAKRAVDLLDAPVRSGTQSDDDLAWTRDDLFPAHALEDVGVMHAQDVKSLPSSVQSTLQTIAAFLRQFVSVNAPSLSKYLQSSPSSRHAVDKSAALAMLGLIEK